jgi:hypothetical protein
MDHHLYLKFLALIAVKGLVVGHAQWTGAISAPTGVPQSLQSSRLTPPMMQQAVPSVLLQQDIDQF